MAWKRLRRAALRARNLGSFRRAKRRVSLCFVDEASASLAFDPRVQRFERAKRRRPRRRRGHERWAGRVVRSGADGRHVSERRVQRTEARAARRVRRSARIARSRSMHRHGEPGDHAALRDERERQAAAPRFQGAPPISAPSSRLRKRNGEVVRRRDERAFPGLERDRGGGGAHRKIAIAVSRRVVVRRRRK